MRSRRCGVPLVPDRRTGPLRLALVGVGSAARLAHLPAIAGLESAGEVVLVGVCDREPSRRDDVIASHPGALGFAENDEMLAATSPDLLVIATPPSAHLGEVAAAAGAGAQVLCEKPLGLSDGDVTALTALCGAHPELMLATVHQYRYAGPWRWITRAARGAVLAGEPFTVEVRVERPGTDPLSAGGWRADAEHEGGILGDHAVHYLSLLRQLDPACEVVGCHREGPGGREVATIRARVGGAGVAVVHVSYAGARRTNLIRLDRPAQCLELAWADGCFMVSHNGRPGSARAVASLSDRAVVNALYGPMYERVVAGIGDKPWGRAATEHTLGTARLLATAIRLAR
jgi:predicted dehydrogenase